MCVRFVIRDSHVMRRFGITDGYILGELNGLSCVRGGNLPISLLGSVKNPTSVSGATRRSRKLRI